MLTHGDKMTKFTCP